MDNTREVTIAELKELIENMDDNTIINIDLGDYADDNRDE